MLLNISSLNKCLHLYNRSKSIYPTFSKNWVEKLMDRLQMAHNDLFFLVSMTLFNPFPLIVNKTCELLLTDRTWWKLQEITLWFYYARLHWASRLPLATLFTSLMKSVGKLGNPMCQDLWAASRSWVSHSLRAQQESRALSPTTTGN